MADLIQGNASPQSVVRSFHPHEPVLPPKRQPIQLDFENPADAVDQWLRHQRSRSQALLRMERWQNSVSEHVVRWIEQSLQGELPVLARGYSEPWPLQERDKLARLDTTLRCDHRFLSQFLKWTPMRVQRDNLMCDRDFRYITLLSAVVLDAAAGRQEGAVDAGEEEFASHFQTIYRLLARVKHRQMELQGGGSMAALQEGALSPLISSSPEAPSPAELGVALSLSPDLASLYTAGLKKLNETLQAEKNSNQKTWEKALEEQYHLDVLGFLQPHLLRHVQRNSLTIYPGRAILGGASQKLPLHEGSHQLLSSALMRLAKEIDNQVENRSVENSRHLILLLVWLSSICKHWPEDQRLRTDDLIHILQKDL